MTFAGPNIMLIAVRVPRELRDHMEAQEESISTQVRNALFLYHKDSHKGDLKHLKQLLRHAESAIVQMERGLR